jgi:hypothetical protein
MAKVIPFRSLADELKRAVPFWFQTPTDELPRDDKTLRAMRHMLEIIKQHYSYRFTHYTIAPDAYDFLLLKHPDDSLVFLYLLMKPLDTESTANAVNHYGNELPGANSKSATYDCMRLAILDMIAHSYSSNEDGRYEIHTLMASLILNKGKHSEWLDEMATTWQEVKTNFKNQPDERFVLTLLAVAITLLDNHLNGKHEIPKINIETFKKE